MAPRELPATLLEINPVTYALRVSGLSQVEAAKLIGFSRELVSRSEFAMPVNLNASMLRWIQQVLSGSLLATRMPELLNAFSILDWYKRFQKGQRLHTLQLKGLIERTETGNFIAIGDLAKVTFMQPSQEAFMEFRAAHWNSMREFATTMCTEPNRLLEFESGIRPNIPKQVWEALTCFEGVTE